MPNPTSPSPDPGVQGSATERKVAMDNSTERSTQQRKPFTNSRGEKTIYPSEVFGFQNANNLTATEAEQIAQVAADGGDVDKAIEDAKASRYVFRQTYEKAPAVSNSLTMADAQNEARRIEAEKAREAIDTDIPVDTSLHGQHGPFADYREVDVSAREVAEQTGLPVEATKTIQGVK